MCCQGVSRELCGIALDAEWYRPLFEEAVTMYGEGVFSWYFDLPFEETLRRHDTKPNRNEFGEAEMRRWWKARDYSDVLHEQTLTAEREIDEIVWEILESIGRVPENRTNQKG